MSQNKLLNIIINADDLGANEYINKEIERFIKIRSISSATILANGPAFDGVKDIVDAYPHISFGIHLNLMEFKSLTNSNILFKFGIIDNNGNFIKGRIFKQKFFSQELKKALYDELDEQFKKVRSLGINISHIDSHLHTHINISLLDIITSLANVYGVKKIRNPLFHSLKYLYANNNKKAKNPRRQKEYLNSTKGKSLFYKLLAFIFDQLGRRFWQYRARKNFILTHHFFSYNGFYKIVCEFPQNNFKGTIELMCHPGHSLYVEESIMVEKKLLKEIINYQLINYNSSELKKLKN